MKKLTRILSLALCAALLMTSFCFAAATEDREALASCLEQLLLYEEVVTGTGTQYSKLIGISCYASDELGCAVVYANGSNIDGLIKQIAAGDDSSNSTVLLILLNLAGKIAKIAKQYELDEIPVYLLYISSEEYAGAEYSYMVYIDAANDSIQVQKDDIFGMTGNLTISEYYDSETFEFVG